MNNSNLNCSNIINKELQNFQKNYKKTNKDFTKYPNKNSEKYLKYSISIALNINITKIAIINIFFK